MIKQSALISLLILSGCAMFVGHQLDQQFGSADSGRYDRPVTSASISFRDDIQPILDQRCVVCHACYDSPCQLKLDSWDGVARGGSKTKVYDGARLIASQPTRLFEDADTASQWRTMGFHPVLNERSSDADLSGSVLARMLELKQQHPLPNDPLLSDEFDLSIDREQECPTIEEFDKFANRKPLWGMPYGLPGISAQEHDTLKRWLAAGAPFEGLAPLTAEEQQSVDRWEMFLNQESLKGQLSARYLYEHLYLASLYFAPDENQRPRFFQIIRSRTAPGSAPDRISTRRPYDDPVVDRVYYRIIPAPSTIVAKTHMPYRLDDKRLADWQNWFIDADYTVDNLPGYEPTVAGNPFIAFQAIPVKSRYRFLLDEARFTVMNFIKGPVCRGQIALNVINDYFWVAFVDPDITDVELDTEFLAEVRQDLRLPIEEESNAGLLSWRAYAAKEKQYLAKKAQVLDAYAEKIPLSLDLIWDGDGTNNNAGLTIFRNYDTATVVKGLIGDIPQTAWVINYSLLERIHYLLVAGFDVHGNIGHQLNSRLYMDFLRMEGEYNFLMLLPEVERQTIRDHWYRGASDEVKEYLFDGDSHIRRDTEMTYRTNRPILELYDRLKTHLTPVLDTRLELNTGWQDSRIIEPLRKLSLQRGKHLNHLPQVSVITVVDNQNEREQDYTLLHHYAYSNIAHLFLDNYRRLPDEDRLSVLRGVVSAHPNSLFRVDVQNLGDFERRIANLKSKADYADLRELYGVRRTAADFWRHSDQLHSRYLAELPIESGVIDYNRLENR